MWIFLNNAYISVVSLNGARGALTVRARFRGDLERLFPGEDVLETPNRDYRFRVTLPRDAVAKAIGRAVMGISYRNFKDSVQEHHRHDAYLQVWGAMYRAQHAAIRREEGEMEEGYEEYPLFKETSPKGAGASQNRRRSAPRRS